MQEICRTCGELSESGNAINLYAQSENILLHQIEVLTGLWLEKQPEMPECICSRCQNDLKQTVEFRERCITTQQYLQLRRKDLLTMTMITKEPIKFEVKDEFVKIEDNNECQLPPGRTDDVNWNYNADAANTDNEIGCDLLCDNNSYSIIDFEEYLKPDDDDFAENLSPYTDVEAGIDDDDNGENDNIEKCVDNQEGNDEDSCLDGDGIFNYDKELSNNIVIENPRDAADKRTKCRFKWQYLSEEEDKALKRERRKINYICEQCGRHFNCHSNFKLHLLRHTGVKNYPCDICNERFYTKHLLKRHGTKHTNKRPYTCKYCERAFRSCSSKVKHERNHTNVRPFQCRHCEKSFTNWAYRRDHEVTHTGVRNFFCDICNQAFLRRPHLRQHFRSKSHKSNEKKFTIKRS